MATENSMDWWRDKWRTGITHWHLKDLNPQLVRFVNHLLGGRKDGLLFIPLCGKCVDMRWLYDQGYKILAVDCCEEAILDFFREQNLVFETIVESKNAKVFQTLDGRLRIMCRDILSLDKETCGPITAIWDRGSLVAMDKENRRAYAAMMKTLVEPDFRYLLDVLHYNDWYCSGPPRNVPPELIEDLYGDCFQIELLLQRNITEGYSKRFGVEPVYNNIYLMTLKK